MSYSAKVTVDIPQGLYATSIDSQEIKSIEKKSLNKLNGVSAGTFLLLAAAGYFFFWKRKSG